MKRSLSLAALLSTALLAACSGGSEAPPAVDNEVENTVVIDETPTENMAMEVEPSPTPTPTPTPTPVAEKLSESEQVQEDADAVGMTSRLPRQDEEAPAQPAE